MDVRRDEEGSIVLMMLIMLVVTALVVTTVAVSQQGLRTSRRAGDSANALQVADAAINEAVAEIPRVAGATFSRSKALGVDVWPGSCPTGRDCYTFTATRDAGPRPVWHIDATGTDKTGVKRRVKASAVAVSVFSSPLYVHTTMNLSSGISLDSYSSGMSHADMCTKKGIIGTSNPAGMTFGSSGGGQGVSNCQNRLLNNGWAYSMDGCTSYGKGGQALPPIGPARCPPVPDTFKTIRTMEVAEIKAPTTPCSTSGADPQNCVDFAGTELICPSTAHPSLQGGKTYSFQTVSLLDGCRVGNPVMNASGGGVDLSKPTRVVSPNITVGRQSGGANQLINQPPALASVCGPTATSSLVDGAGLPARWYCPGWTGGLRLLIPTGQNANKLTILGNSTKLWAAMEAPTGEGVKLDGSQITVFGAVVANIAGSNAQFTWHFDAGLTAITSAQSELQNWREEPIS